MPFIDCKINLISTNDAKATTFGITDIKLYDRIVALSTRDNAKLLEQLKSQFKRTINWDKYESKVSLAAPNSYLDFIINPSFQGVNRILFSCLKIMKIQK